MVSVKDATSQFLARKRIAATGVSRRPQGHGSNAVRQRLRDRGYRVSAVNPNVDQVEGDRCCHDLASVPGGAEAVVIGTAPRPPRPQCANAAALASTPCGCTAPSVPAASPRPPPNTAPQQEITVIDGGCLLMSDPTADAGDKAMRLVFTCTGKVPRKA